MPLNHLENLQQGLKGKMKKMSKAFDEVFEQIIKDHEDPSASNKKSVHSEDFVDIPY